MTDALLKPPARFSHGLLVGLVLAIAGLLTAAIAQLPTLVVALGTLAVFLGGFSAFSRDAWIYTAIGTIAVIVGAHGVLMTAIWAFFSAAGAPSAGGFLLSLTVALSVVAGVVAVVGEIIPSRVTNQDGPAIVALLYAGGLAAVTVMAIVGIQLGLASLFGTSVSSLVGTAGEFVAGAMTLNPVTKVGSLAFLVGAVLWYATRIGTLPLFRRLGRWIALRGAGVADRDWPSGGTEDSARADDDRAIGDTSTGPPSVTMILGLPARWSSAPRLIGAGLFYIGFGTFVLALTPELQTVATDHAFARLLGSLLGSTTAPQWTFLGLLFALIIIRLGHSIAWRGINLNWIAYERRLGYGSGALLAVFVSGLLGRRVVDGLLAVPAFQFVPMGEFGPVLVATDTGIRFVEAGATGVSFEPRPTVFEGWFGGFVELIGPAVFGIVLLVIVVLLSIFLLVGATIFVAGARLSRPGAGIGLLFVSSAGAAVLGAGELVAFMAGAGAILAWELYAYGDGLHSQLDPGASTVTAEMVHLGGSVVFLVVAVGVTLVGLRALRYVPPVESTWQVFGALLLSLAALVLGILYLGLRGDNPSPATESG